MLSKIPTAKNLRWIVAKSPVRALYKLLKIQEQEAWVCAVLAANSQTAAEQGTIAGVPLKNI